jgi:hypothetical protein
MMRDMIHRLGRRLSLFFDRPAGGAMAVEDGHPGAAVLHPMVDFVAFAEDCLLSGRIRLRAERLTDMLNEHEELLLVDVMAQPLREPDIVEVTEVLVRRDELLMVNATGPRGDQARRTRTRPTFVAIDIGPYAVRGNLHAQPGFDAVAGIRRRRPMVPLTDAWVDYPFGGRPLRQRLGTAIVNRDRIDLIVQSLEYDVDVPDLAVEPLADAAGGIGPGLLVGSTRSTRPGP